MTPEDNWLLLVTNLPGRNQTLRMRIWRALKSTGAALLRDGVYLLPALPASRHLFEAQGEEIQAGGGSAHVLSFASASQAQQASLAAMFDRTSEYASLAAGIDQLKRKLARLKEPEARRRMAVVRRGFEALSAIDFFPSETRRQVEAALTGLEAMLAGRFAPDEPHFVKGTIPRRDSRQYRNRVWATRERLWVDRICSAWLIRRYIDPKARFLWLKRASDCPKRAVGFDFDGAEFSHVDGRVTFEVLLATFGLEQRPGLARLGALVHYLDAGGIPVAEAAGFSAILAGARARQPDDDALIRAMTPVIDSLHATCAETDSEAGNP